MILDQPFGRRLRGLVGICAFLVGLSLAGCTTAPDPSYRDTALPLSITTRSAPDLWQGTWYLRAATPDQDAVSKLRFAAGQITPDCAPGCGAGWQVRPIAANRWHLSKAVGQTREFWLIWIDENGRTAAVGEPDGRYAWILDRRPRGGADRIQAAREILEFNGYDAREIALRQDEKDGV